MIRLVRLGGVRIECSIPMLLLSFLMLVYLGGETVIVVYLALTLHEASHTLTAIRLGYAVTAVELQPFGFVARIAGDFASWHDELRIAAAGPVTSLVAASAAAALSEYMNDGGLLALFAEYNLTLALVNLLPALPLDGGRMLRALLYRVDAAPILSWSGIILGVTVAGLGVWLLYEGEFGVTALLMGAFLTLAAVRELRLRASIAVSAFLKRGDALRRGGCIEVRCQAVSGSVTVLEAVRMLSAGRYTVLTVVDEAMRSVGSIDEGRLMRAMSLYGGDAFLADVMRRAD